MLFQIKGKKVFTSSMGYFLIHQSFALELVTEESLVSDKIERELNLHVTLWQNNSIYHTPGICRMGLLPPVSYPLRPWW